MAYIRINPVPVNSRPFIGREITPFAPCKYSLRLWDTGELNEGKHLGDFDTYFEALVFATKYSQEHNVGVKDNTYPEQRQ